MEPIVQKAGSATFVYFGSTRSIRGYTVLLEAMTKLPAHMKLSVLARGLEGAGAVEMKKGLKSRGLADRVRVTGGWQTSEQMKAEMQCALAVVLPFVLVPSEVPVSVLEVTACGTPVIVTDIDGLPESVGEAGVVVPPGDAAQLAAAMLKLANQPDKVAALRRACLRRRETFQDWDAVAERWEAVLNLSGG
jgi:glycosyltransferase involved in cell wall biosynthesis